VRLLLFVVTVLVALGLLLHWLNHIGGWRAHVLAIVLGIIVALVMTFLPAEYLASLNALLGQ
jgi:fructose-specific phosphotransferase system IIC component